MVSDRKKSTKTSNEAEKRPKTDQRDASAPSRPPKIKKALPHTHAHAHNEHLAHVMARLSLPNDRRLLMAGVVLALVLFSTGLGAGFAFDDKLAIMGNADADARTPLMNVFMNDFWGHNLHAVVSNRSFRPLIVLSFRLQHFLLGYRHSAFFLHAVNYVVAYFNACLVFYLARLYAIIIFSKSSSSSTSTVPNQLYTLPALAMALFLAHPVHVDAVSSIVGRCEIFYCFFGLIAFFMSHRYLIGVRSAAANVRLLVGVVVLMTLCVFSKDSGIVFAALLVVHAFTLRWVRVASTSATSVLCALCVAMVAVYFAFRRQYIGSLDLSRSPLLRRSETPQLFVPNDRWHWWSMRWVIQMKNLQLLFFPTSLSCEYSYNCIPPLESLEDPRALVYALVTCFTVVCGFVVLFFALQRRNVVALTLLLSLLWIAIPYAPVSHLFVQIGTFVAERCLYVPSVGSVLFMVFAVANRSGEAGGQSQRLRYVPLVVLLVLWSLISVSQNTVWKDDESLFRSAIATCPNSGKLHNLLATALVDRTGTISDEAVEHFEKGYAIDPDLREALYYLAVDAWQNKRDSHKAYSLIRKCAGHPLTLSRCYPVMQEMRAYMHPQNKPFENAIDDAAIAVRNSDVAAKYREAGELLVRDEKDYCYAKNIFSAAMVSWSKSGLTWRFDDVAPFKMTSMQFCSTVARAAQAAQQCYTVQRPREYKAANNTASDVFKYDNVERFLRRIVDGVGRCYTDWTRPEALSAGNDVMETYPMQVSQFVPLSTTVMDSLTAIYTAGYTEASDAQKTAAEQLILEVALRRYCSTAGLSESNTLTKKLQRLVPHELRQKQAEFKEKQQEWLKEIHSLIGTLSVIAPGDVNTQGLLQNFTHCVPELHN